MTYAARKLIEVALPLEAINKASAREKSIRHGHPSTLHLWWARRPLAAARAVIFSQMVDDPTEYVDELLSDPALKRAAERELKKRETLWADRDAKGEEQTVERATLRDCLADLERERLFALIEELVQWENTTNEVVLNRARAEIWQSWRRACAKNADHPRAKELFDRNKLPAFHDPFAGGGTLPLEAQRLGLEAYATDLNPVAVLINKAMIEIPPKFAGRPPVNPEARSRPELLARDWKGAQGLAEDVRYYGRWMRDEAEKRIGHLYPKVAVTAAMAAERPDLKPHVGSELTVVAWLWARTVKSPNPAFRTVDVPLASTFVLSSKVGKEAWVEPVIQDGGYRFEVRTGGKAPESAKAGTKLSRGANFKCLMSGITLEPAHTYGEANAGRMGARLMAIVAESDRGRVYLDPIDEHEVIARSVPPAWAPDVEMPTNPRWFSPPLYGLKTFGDLFTPRQLVALNTFSDLIAEARVRSRTDALAAALPNGNPLFEGGAGAQAYADTIGLYLAFSLDKMTDTNTSLCSWQVNPPRLRATFGRQALPMVWDYAEACIFGDAAGDYQRCVQSLTEVLERHLISGAGFAAQMSATQLSFTEKRVISTDPPYYDNIGYADLSDFFYVWLRKNVRPFLSGFDTLTTPKNEELVATPYRHGTKTKAEAFFLSGMGEAMSAMASLTHESYPTTIYYAFKQSESSADDGTASTGWETFLDAVVAAGFAISGTWPARSEMASRNVGRGTNALASSIILVCRPRDPASPTATRREFLDALKAELPRALDKLQRGNIAPVDLAQASIGPGMRVYTRFARVVDAEGGTLAVREALALINQTLDEVLAEQEGDFDADSRWAVTWFDSYGFDEGDYGVAEVLSKAKATAVSGLVDAGIIASGRGHVRLLRPSELSPAWDPATDPRLSVWEITHQLIRRLELGGEADAADLVARLGVKAEVARELAYRLYVICERKKRATEAMSYNGLVQSWPEITRLAREGPASTPASQGELSLT